MTLVLKDPASSLDYRVDWAASYLDEDVLLESDWSVLPVEAGGLTIDGSRFDTGAATVNVSGGQPGKIYRLINQVTMGSGREDSRSILLRVEVR